MDTIESNINVNCNESEAPIYRYHKMFNYQPSALSEYFDRIKKDVVTQPSDIINMGIRSSDNKQETQNETDTNTSINPFIMRDISFEIWDDCIRVPKYRTIPQFDGDILGIYYGSGINEPQKIPCNGDHQIEKFDNSVLYKYYIRKPENFIDIDTTINLDQLVKEIITCPICICVMENPSNYKCQHTFCYECIKQQNNSMCPLCREETQIKDIIPNKKLQQKINKIKINCQICDKIHKISDNCDNRVICTFCKLEISWDAFVDHLEKDCCVIKKCPHCELHFYCGQYDHHVLSCDNKKIFCDECLRFYIAREENSHKSFHEHRDMIVKLYTKRSKYSSYNIKPYYSDNKKYDNKKFKHHKNVLQKSKNTNRYSKNSVIKQPKRGY